MEDTVKQRLIQFIKYKELSQAKFEKAICAGNGFVNNISKSIGAEKLQSILYNFPEIDANWLLYGKGEMLKSEKKLESKIITPTDNTRMIPVLPIAAQGGTLNDFTLAIQESDCERIISPISGADFAMPIAGDSMAPDYPSGSQVLVKKIDETAFIEWGKTYVLDTCNGSVIKVLMPSESDDRVRCVSINKEYPPFEVRFVDIFGIYRVMMLMAIK